MLFMKGGYYLVELAVGKRGGHCWGLSNTCRQRHRRDHRLLSHATASKTTARPRDKQTEWCTSRAKSWQTVAAALDSEPWPLIFSAENEGWMHLWQCGWFGSWTWNIGNLITSTSPLCCWILSWTPRLDLMHNSWPLVVVLRLSVGSCCKQFPGIIRHLDTAT